MGLGPRLEHLKLVHSMAGELLDLTLTSDGGIHMLDPAHGTVNPGIECTEW